MKNLSLYLLCILLLLILVLTACSAPNYFISNRMLEKGNIIFDEEKYDEAIVYYDKAIKYSKFNATAYGNRAAALNFLDRYKEAIEASEKALSIAPNIDMLHLNKGAALNGIGEYKKAIESFDRAIELNPELVDAYNSKGSAYYYMENYEEALEQFNLAVKLDSNFYNAYLWKAKVFIAQEHYDEAFDALNKAIALNKDQVDAYLDKLDMMYDLEDYEGCIDFGQYALKKFPENVDINWYIADCYAAQFQHDNAIRFYIQAMNIDPDNNQLSTYAAWEYFYKQDYIKAQEYVDKVLKSKGDSSEVQELQKELEKTKLPEAERIVTFVEDNYLYLNEVKDFEDISSAFKKDTDLTTKEIADYVDLIKIKQDIFTFVISGEEYDYLALEESINQVSSMQLDDSTQYIRIESFTEATGYDFKKALSEIKDTANKNLVIDLRGNAGGMIDSSNDILDYLLPECSTSYVIDRNGYINSYFSNKSQIKFKKILILVDENSASSAELLTLGLKKYLDNVVVIGRPTFGKGVGQSVYEDKSKKYMIFLVSFYWNVLEENITKSKIYPDVKIKSHSVEEYNRAIKAQIK